MQTKMIAQAYTLATVWGNYPVLAPLATPSGIQAVNQVDYRGSVRFWASPEHDCIDGRLRGRPAVIGGVVQRVTEEAQVLAG